MYVLCTRYWYPIELLVNFLHPVTDSTSTKPNNFINVQIFGVLSPNSVNCFLVRYLLPPLHDEIVSNRLLPIQRVNESTWAEIRVYDVVIVACGFWYKPHSQPIIFRLTKAIPLLMRIVGVTHTQPTLAFFISAFLSAANTNDGSFFVHFWFIFGVFVELNAHRASHHLRFEWGQAWFTIEMT